MTKTYTNDRNIPLSVAVYLANDTYQQPPDDGKKYISATTLLKSTRQIILTSRADGTAMAKPVDIAHMSASRGGTALHDAIESAWVNNYKGSMEALGYPQNIIDKVVLNPEKVEPGQIPVYMEQRFYKPLGDWIVTGQFDFCGDGRLEDFKQTGTYTYTSGNKDEDYSMQGSIYKWGMPDIITKDVMAIQFFFKDWNSYSSKQNNYPPADMVEKEFPLKDTDWTENWIRRKLAQIDMYSDMPENALPECTDKELWRTGTKWKYYKNPKGVRATKVFDSPQEANLRFVQDGSVGIVKEVKPPPRACMYCAGFNACSQKDKYIDSGELKI